MNPKTRPSSSKLSRRGAVVAIVIALVASVAMWAAMPFNDLVLRNAWIGDTYLPLAPMAFIIFLVLVANPILRWVRRTWTLSFAQLTVVLTVLMVGAIPVGTGLLHWLPYGLTMEMSNASRDKVMAKRLDTANLRPCLFPGEFAYGVDAPAAKYFLYKLPKGAKIPWRPWLKPLAAWGTLAMFGWIALIGMGGILFPQWRHNEKLAFPLLAVRQALMGTPSEGSVLPPAFRRPGFWAGAGAVFLIYVIYGLGRCYPGSVPDVPVGWNISDLLSAEPFRYLPWYCRSSRIYFAVIGLAFFMPNRVSLSVWFIPVAYAIYAMAMRSLAPPFIADVIHNQRDGAFLAIAAFVIWIGRAHWLHVARCVILGARTDEERTHRSAGILFIVGTIGMFLWFVWARVQIGWAAFFVLMILLYALVNTRIVAETGLVVIGLYDWHIQYLMFLWPVTWVNGATAWFAGIVSWIAYGPATCLAATTAHAYGLDEMADPDGAPRRRRRVWPAVFLGILLLSLVLGGVVHLYTNYNFSKSMDGAESPFNAWGTWSGGAANYMLRLQYNGAWDRPVYSQPLHMGIGAAITAFLYWACLTMPKWPLHPVGLVLVWTWYSDQIWAGAFIGWLAKIVIVFLGGAHGYTRARAVFLGLIFGEVLAGIVWSIVPPVLHALGSTYTVVRVWSYQ